MPPPVAVAARYDKGIRIAGGSAGGWRLETEGITLKVAPREKEGWLDSHSMEVFPCTDLCAIDRLRS